MNLRLSSCAELYAEHRRTPSRRKRAKIAAELQRRHDDWNCPPGFEGDRWWVYVETVKRGALNIYFEDLFSSFQRFDFAIWMP